MEESASKQKKRAKGQQCCVYGCMNYFNVTGGVKSGLHFFKIPKEVLDCKPKRERWCQLIKRQDGRDGLNLTKYTLVCQEHFRQSDIKVSMWNKRWYLQPGTQPVIFSPGAQKECRRKSPRKRLFLTPTCKSSVSTETMEFDEDIAESGVASQTEFMTSDQSTQTEPVFHHEIDTAIENNNYSFNPHMAVNSGDVNELKESVKYLTGRISSMNERMSSLSDHITELTGLLETQEANRFCLDNVKDDDSAMLFYTGFPNYNTFDAVFSYLEQKASNMVYWRGQKESHETRYYQCVGGKPGRKRKLCFRDEFFMVIVRLIKVGLFVRDISGRFEISVSQFSKIFTTWINLLHLELPRLFPFPSQDKIRRDMSQSFINYPTTRIILDCTELFVEIPSSMTTQSETWSNYKHHNTYKVLVGVTPRGSVSFISRLWGGRVSDNEITKESGILEMLQPGDNVMADRGFDIADILPQGVSLNIPPFKTGKQLTSAQVLDTMSIASVRIHVERAIGRIKNYHILDGVIPLSLSHRINQIFTVIAYLTCFLPPLVKE